VCGYVLLQTSVLHLFNIQLPRCRRYKGLKRVACIWIIVYFYCKKSIFSRTFSKTWPWQKSKIANSTCPGPTIDYCIQQRRPKQIGPTGFFGYTFTTPKTMLQSSSNLLRQRLQNPVLRLIASFSSSNAIQNDPYKFRPQTDSKVFDNRGELKEFKPMDIQAKMDKIFNGAEAEKEKKAMNVHSDGPMGVGILGK
jgi:hypothetical protein